MSKKAHSHFRRDTHEGRKRNPAEYVHEAIPHYKNLFGDPSLVDCSEVLLGQNIPQHKKTEAGQLPNLGLRAS
jgi:hypothetical protein